MDDATLALVRLAAAIAAGDQDTLEAAASTAADQDVPAAWVDELILQSVLMVGWPRALNAATAWRTQSGHPAPVHDPDEDYGRAPDWAARGERVCRVVYGSNYDKLRRNVQRLHPALDRWMVVEGYGRTIGRPGLDLARRELCTVAQCAVLEVPRQLHSHLKGALHAGAGEIAVTRALAEAAPFQSAQGREASRAVWEAVRA